MIEHVPPYRVEPMRWGDVPEVMAIERKSFPLPWSDYTYRHEILENRNAHYFVARRMNDRAISKPASWWGRMFKPEVKAPVVGYGGFWIVVDEAHISAIASDVRWRGHGIGELILLAMIDRSIELGAHEMTLEVRVSNTVAQNLYRKYGFEVVGQRPGYYRDNNEDADLMTLPSVYTAEYQAKLKALQEALEDRLRQDKIRSM